MRKVGKKAKDRTAAQQVRDLVGGARTKPKARKKPSIEKLCRETRDFIEDDEWDDAKPRHLVGLYIILHTWCYEVAPADMVGPNLMGAMSAAKKLVADEFGDSMGDAVGYVKWAWGREKGREQWRRKRQIDGKRLTWRTLLVYREYVTEYRMASARRQHG